MGFEVREGLRGGDEMGCGREQRRVGGRGVRGMSVHHSSARLARRKVPGLFSGSSKIPGLEFQKNRHLSVPIFSHPQPQRGAAR